jgi:D-alanyl-D-alanine carboxypeptidase
MKYKTKNKIKYIFWALFVFCFGIILATVSTQSFGQEKTIELVKEKNDFEKIENSSEKNAENYYFIKNPNKKIALDAEAYLVGDLDTGEIILEKNKDSIFPIASVSKLMTALVSLEKQNQEELAIVSKSALDTYGKNGGLSLGEKIKVGDLIYPLLLESSNDTAEVLAENSGRNNFIKFMNEKASEIGMKNTSFQDPSGLSEFNRSTVFDLFNFTKYLKNEKADLLKLTTQRSYNNKKHIWFNNSQFLGINGYVGGKRGYIDESKQTALSAFTLPLSSTGFRNIGIIILRSSDRLKDMQNLISFLNKNVYYGGEEDADMDWVKQRNGIIEPNYVTLLFGGDLMLDRGVKNSVLKNFNGDYSALFEKLPILQKADITFANLEGPASDKGKDLKNLYSFRMNPSIAPALKGAGFSILSVANNHVGDWGRNAYEDSLAHLKENELLYTGSGLNKVEAEKPIIIEKYGMKIGFLGFSDVGPEWMKATEDSAGILLASDPNFSEIIKKASTEVDYLIVSLHFGNEYKTIHNNRQEYLAHKAIDAGARIIIGHHPHVIQDSEIYKNGLILYSLGNFIFDQKFSENTMQGMLAEIKIGKDGNMVLRKDIMKLNSVFQPDKIIKGKEEKIIFENN